MGVSGGITHRSQQADEHYDNQINSIFVGGDQEYANYERQCATNTIVDQGVLFGKSPKDSISIIQLNVLETHGSEEISNQLDIDLQHRLSNKQYLNQNKMIQMVTENISDSSESQYRIVNKENLEEDEPSETMEVGN